MQRDRQVNAALEAMGYTVLRFWSKEVLKDLDGVIEKIELVLNSNYYDDHA
jgi:DNA mismatch endonuclease (patch repair protein)